MHYPVVIHKDPDSDYGVTVPDVLGYFSAGETIEEALAYVGEAIECHIEKGYSFLKKRFCCQLLLKIISKTLITPIDFGPLLILI